MKRIEQLKSKLCGEEKSLKVLKLMTDVEMMDFDDTKSYSCLSMSKGEGQSVGDLVGHHHPSSGFPKSKQITNSYPQVGTSNRKTKSVSRRSNSRETEKESDQEILIRSDSSDSFENIVSQSKKYKLIPDLTLSLVLPKSNSRHIQPSVFSKIKGEFLSPSGRSEDSNCTLKSQFDPVYKETTEELNSDLTDEMNRYREEMSEIDPLRGDEEWSSGDAQNGNWNGIFQRHSRMLHWALFFAATAVSVLIFFSVLAIVLEAQSTKSPNAVLTEISLPPQSTVDEVAFVPQHVPLTSTVKDLEKLTSRSWPLEDVATRDLNEFKLKYLLPKQSQNGKVKSNRLMMSAGSGLKIANVNVISDAVKIAQQAKLARDQTESHLVQLGMQLKSMSPFGRLSISARKMTDETRRRGATGFFIDRVSRRISQKLNMSKEEAQQGIPWNVDGDLRDYLPNEFCKDVLNTTCKRSDIYRSYDGSCNNLHHVNWGTANAPYRRILLPDYADGISIPRTASDGTSSLPNPRQLSSTILKDDPTEDARATMMLVLWGQFLDHDISYTAPSTGLNGTAITCCTNGQLIEIQHQECYPFTMSDQDEFYSSVGQKCTNFVRSAPSPICHLGPREQFNQITSYLDASTLYGSTEIEHAQVMGRLATANPGRLPLSWLDDGRPLPQRSVDLDDGCNTPEEVEKRQFCFTSGDKRINEYIGITSLNLIWSRQHNEIAERLISVNPHWLNSDLIFEESRRLVIAQIQHITYNEFLPLLLGPDLVQAAGLQLVNNGYYDDYDQEVNPTISNVFSAAAFRLGHSLIQGLIKMVGPRWKNEDFIQIHKLFFNPLRLYDLGRMDAIIRGHVDSPSGKADLHFSKQITEHLFQLRNSTYGLDLAAIDIQRGRDHGISDYVAWRKICGLTEVKEFSDLAGIWSIESVQAVQKAYRSIQDIDLYIGGLAEIPLKGAMVGPVFGCLLADQFNRLRKGDRFWYEGNVQLKPFTPDQLQMIRKTTLAHILCVNSDDIESLQVRVMEKLSTSNPRIPCRKIPELDYRPWKENPTPTKLKSAPIQPVKSIANATSDSLEELYEEDEEEQRFEAEKEKDRQIGTKSNNRTKSVTDATGITDGLLFADPKAKQFSRNKIIIAYGTTSSPTVEMTTLSNSDQNEQHSMSENVEFHHSKDGIIIEWRSRRSDPNNTKILANHDYEDI